MNPTSGRMIPAALESVAMEPAAGPLSAAGRLYIVGVPIGNPEDLSLRALRVLKEVDLIAAEDTRVTRRLLRQFDIRTPSTAYSQHSGGLKAAALAERIAAGERVALVSDAGMPGIADPGWELIRLCVERAIPVVPVPGPNAALTALAASGLPAQRFVFDGFPPRQRKNRITFFARLRGESRTVVLYESPRRLRETLQDLAASLGPERQIAVARDLTKTGEHWFRGSLEEVSRHFDGAPALGEIVLIVEGAAPSRKEQLWLSRTAEGCPADRSPECSG